jgi:hypothetical protein
MPPVGETAPNRRKRRHRVTLGLELDLEGNEYEKTSQFAIYNLKV